MSAVEVSGFVTRTSTRRPGPSAGVVAVIVVSLTTETLPAGRPPNVTDAPGWKSWPVIVTGLAVSGTSLRWRIAGPCVGLTEKRLRSENSDVLPASSVAVALIQTLGAPATGKVMSKGRLPWASVTAGLSRKPIQV